MGEFQRHEDTVSNQRGTKTGTESQKQHATAFITSKSFHRGVMDHLNRTAEGFFKVETHPSITQILEFCRRPTVQDRSGIPKRYDLVRPIGGRPSDLLTIYSGIMFGADETLRGMRFPVARILRLVPPTSTTSTLKSDGKFAHRCSGDASPFPPQNRMIARGRCRSKSTCCWMCKKTVRIDSSWV